MKSKIGGRITMIGKPKYERGDIVKFTFRKPGVAVDKVGYVYIVDAYGTFDQTEEPSYDVMVDMDHCLYKHIRESEITLVMKK